MNSRQLAEKIRHESGIMGVVDDVSDIARWLGFEVIEAPLPFDKTSYVVYDATIGVADDLTPERRRWATACGIGHALMIEQAVIYRENGRMGHELLPDVAAQDFAFWLLVPLHDGYRLGMRTAGELAEHYGLTEVVVACRMWLSADSLGGRRIEGTLPMQTLTLAPNAAVSRFALDTPDG